MKIKNILILCFTLIFTLTGCTPAAYDGGKTEEKTEKEIDLDVVNLMEHQSVDGIEKYLKESNISAKKKGGTAWKVAWCNNDMSDEQMAYVTKSSQEYAKKKGIELICFDGQSDPQKQIDQINQAIIQKCDAVIVSPIDSSAINIAMKKARDNGLVVISSYMPVSDDKYYDIYVGPSDVTAGQQAASMAVKALPEGGQVAVIQGQIGSAAQINRDKGFEKVLEKYSKFKVVEKQTGNWTTVEAMNVMESYLAKYSKLKAVFCHNDAEALGAVQAIQNAKRTDIKVIGIDGMQSAIDMVSKGGVYYGTSMQPAKLTAQVQLSAALACLNGDKEKLDKMMYIENICVLKENASQIKSGWGGE